MAKQRFSVSVPAEACSLKTIRAFFRSVLEDAFGDQAEKLILALDESCSNVLKYRCAEASEALHVTAEILPDSVSFRIEDYCDKADIPRIKPRDLDAVRPGGLGTHFVGHIMDRVTFESDDEESGRMTLVLEKVIPRDAPAH